MVDVAADVIEQFRLVRGTALVIAVTLRDSAGVVVADFDGTEALTCQVWPGASLPVVASPVATWEDPEEGNIFITVEPDDTSGLSSGRYRLVLTIDDSVRIVAAFECVLIVIPGPPV